MALLFARHQSSESRGRMRELEWLLQMSFPINFPTLLMDAKPRRFRGAVVPTCSSSHLKDDVRIGRQDCAMCAMPSLCLHLVRRCVRRGRNLVGATCNMRRSIYASRRGRWLRQRKAVQDHLGAKLTWLSILALLLWIDAIKAFTKVRGKCNPTHTHRRYSDNYSVRLCYPGQ
jgi:hypothetical protein